MTCVSVQGDGMRPEGAEAQPGKDRQYNKIRTARRGGTLLATAAHVSRLSSSSGASPMRTALRLPLIALAITAIMASSLSAQHRRPGIREAGPDGRSGFW